MSKSVIPLQQGFDYQSRLFWLKVCDMFLPNSKIETVGFELDELKSLDDVVVSYFKPIMSLSRVEKHKDYYQSKFHAHQTNPILHTSLSDPVFINASSKSFLQKLLDARAKARELNHTHIYHLFTPAVIHPEDALAKVYNNFDNSLNIKALFTGTTPRSATYNIRDSWCKHLEINDEDLRDLVSALRIVQGPSSKALLEVLETRLLLSGLSISRNTTLSNPYDDLIRKLHQSDRNCFDRDEIERIARSEDLWMGSPVVGYPKEKTIGIRSFIKFAEEMPNLTSDMICLTSYFEGRHIISNTFWGDKIRPKVTAFMEKHEGNDEKIYVLLDTHLSIAFAAGQAIHPKANATFIPIQKNKFHAPESWPVTGNTDNEGWKIEEMNGGSPEELIVSIGITMPISTDVAAYAEKTLSGSYKLVSFEINPTPSANSVKDGNHAFSLAEFLSQKIMSEVKISNRKVVHIFAAAPVSFMFYLGKTFHLPTSTNVLIYEYDFDSKGLGAYKKSIEFNGD